MREFYFIIERFVNTQLLANYQFQSLEPLMISQTKSTNGVIHGNTLYFRRNSWRMFKYRN